MTAIDAAAFALVVAAFIIVVRMTWNEAAREHASSRCLHAEIAKLKRENAELRRQIEKPSVYGAYSHNGAAITPPEVLREAGL